MTVTETSPIRINCETCGKRAKVAAKLAGRKVRCKCGEAIRVPGAKVKTVSRSEAKRRARDKAQDQAEARPERRERPEPKRRRRPPPKRLYHHEEHLRAIAAWMHVQAVIMVGVLVLLAASLGVGVTYILAGSVSLTWAAAMVGAARLLWSYDPKGRLATAGLMGVAIVLALVQTVLTGAGIVALFMSAGWAGAVCWTLFSSKGAAVFQPEYRARVMAEPVRIKWWKSPFWYVPWGLFVLTVLLILKLASLAGY